MVRADGRIIGRLVGLILGLVAAASSASPPVAVRPDLDLRAAGQVQVIVRQADGKLLVGGGFDRVDGLGRGNVARLLANGAVDPGFAADADGTVRAILVHPGDGRIYLGGDFASVGGVSRAYLARVSPSGVVDPDWPAAAPDGPVFALEFASDLQHLFVGGGFQQPSTRLAKIDLTAGLAAAFAPVPSQGIVYDLLRDGRGGLYVAGSFPSIFGNTMVRRLARVFESGTGGVSGLDTDFDPPTETISSGAVLGLRLDGGQLYAVGSFVNLGGHSFAARLASDSGALDPAWNPQPGGTVQAIAPAAGGALLLGGRFDSVAGVGRDRLARVDDATGALDGGWRPRAHGAVHAILVTPDAVLVGGSFSAAGGQRRIALAALSLPAPGAAVPGFAPELSVPGGVVYALATDAAGRVWLGGDFVSVDGQARNQIARLAPDGLLDASWQLGLVGEVVYDLAVDPLGRVYAGGRFESVDGVPRHSLLRLDASGALDPGLTQGAHRGGAPGEVVELLVAGDQLYLSGGFDAVGPPTGGTLARSDLARIDLAADAVDAAWDPLPGGPSNRFGVQALALDANAGQLYVGGSFTNIDGVARSRVARIDVASGELDPAFAPQVDDGDVWALAYDPELQRLYVGGAFQQVAGQASGYAALARFDVPSGALDAGWSAGLSHAATGDYIERLALGEDGLVYGAGRVESMPAPDGVVRFRSAGASPRDLDFRPGLDGSAFALAFRPGDGRLYVGGYFFSAGGTARQGLAAFALRDLFADGFE